MDGALYKAAIDGSHQDLRGRLTSSNVYEIRSRGQKNTILHVAAKSGKLQLNVEDNGDHLLRCLYEQNNKGNTPLHIAAKLGRVVMATTLVKMARRTDVEQNKRLLSMRNNEQDTALHQAVRHNHLQIVKLLIEEYPDSASEINGDGDSPLFMAVDRCFFTVAFCILNNAPNCSYEGRNGMNALHVAVIRSQKSRYTSTFEEVVLLSVRNIYFTFNQAKANITAKLLQRSDERTDFVLKLLEKFQSGLEKADDFGWTPFHYAAHLGYTGLIKLYLMDENKSLVYSHNKQGMSALHIAAKKGNVDVIRVLIESCPDVCELLDDNDRTALHVAVENRQEKVVKFLLKSLAFQDLINEKDKEGNTALHVASIQGNVEILAVLKNDSKIDKGAANNKGKTYVDIILSNEKLKDIEILEIMVTLGIAIGLPPAPPRLLEEKVDTVETKEGERDDNEKKKDEIQVEEKKAGKHHEGDEQTKHHSVLNQATKDVVSLNLVISTIIASASFAAAFAMPGGYNDQGIPIFNGSIEFQNFLAFDKMAFICSTLSLLIHFLVPLFRKFVTSIFPVLWIAVLTATSLLAMVCALDQAIMTVLPEKPKNSYNPFRSDGIAFQFFSLLCFLYIFSIFTFLISRIVKRSSPHNNVRSRFGLWS